MLPLSPEETVNKRRPIITPDNELAINILKAAILANLSLDFETEKYHSNSDCSKNHFKWLVSEVKHLHLCPIHFILYAKY